MGGLDDGFSDISVLTYFVDGGFRVDFIQQGQRKVFSVGVCFGFAVFCTAVFGEFVFSVSYFWLSDFQSLIALLLTPHELLFA